MANTKKKENKEVEAQPKIAKEVIKRKLNGVVVSNKMEKSVIVMVESTKIHPKYGKRYIASKRYTAHDENNKYKEGDKVTIKQCRPLSKTKKWLVVNK